MEWKEKVGLVSLCPILVVWGFDIFGEWSVLVAQLTPIRWIAIAGCHSAVLLGLIGMYARFPKGTTARLQALQVAVFVVLTWALDSSYLIGKMGHN